MPEALLANNYLGGVGIGLSTDLYCGDSNLESSLDDLLPPLGDLLRGGLLD